MKEKANGRHRPVCAESETSQQMMEMSIAGRVILVGERLGSVTEAAQLGADRGREPRARAPAGICDPA
jgi:hypothetical protein